MSWASLSAWWTFFNINLALYIAQWKYKICCFMFWSLYSSFPASTDRITHELNPSLLVLVQFSMKIKTKMIRTPADLLKDPTIRTPTELNRDPYDTNPIDLLLDNVQFLVMNNKLRFFSFLSLLGNQTKKLSTLHFFCGRLFFCFLFF